MQEEIEGDDFEVLVGQPGVLRERVQEEVLQVEEIGHGRIVGAEVHARGLHTWEGLCHLLRREATAASSVQQGRFAV